MSRSLPGLGRLCWRAFCKAVLAGAGINNGLSVRLCWRVLMWAFCKAVLAGAGKSTGLSVRLCWQGVPEEAGLSVRLCWRDRPAPTREGLGVQPLSRRQVLQLVKCRGGGSNPGAAPSVQGSGGGGVVQPLSGKRSSAKGCSNPCQEGGPASIGGVQPLSRRQVLQLVKR